MIIFEYIVYISLSMIYSCRKHNPTCKGGWVCVFVCVCVCVCVCMCVCVCVCIGVSHGGGGGSHRLVRIFFLYLTYTVTAYQVEYHNPPSHRQASYNINFFKACRNSYQHQHTSWRLWHRLAASRKSGLHCDCRMAPFFITFIAETVQKNCYIRIILRLVSWYFEPCQPQRCLFAADRALK